MIVFCCVLPASNKARDDDDDVILTLSASVMCWTIGRELQRALLVVLFNLHRGYFKY